MRALGWVTLLLGIGLAPLPAAAAPPAGTRIENQAEAQFLDTGTGATLSVLSGRVAAVVSALEALALAADGSASVPAGSAVAFPHRLTNAGNAPSDVRLELANQAGDDFDLAGLALVHDQDADGVADPGEPTLASGTVVSLTSGEDLFLVVTGSVPGAAAAGQVARVELRATTLLQGATASNTDTATVVAGPGGPPTLGYFLDGTFTTPTGVGSAGLPLYVASDAPACNADPGLAETVPLTLRAANSGDVETFAATETAPGSGRFRIDPPVPTADASASPVVPGNGTMEVLPGDTVTAELVGCGAPAPVTASVVMDPSAVVFESGSDAPVAGATVTLIDVTGAGNGGSPGAPARVFAADGTTPAPATVVTGADGRFAFPWVAPSTYRLEVTPPAGFAFPSAVPPGSLPPGHAIDPAASYGSPFTVGPVAGGVAWDVPVDPEAATGLRLTKRASVELAEIGDLVDYLLEVENQTGADTADLRIVDRLPPGFAYRSGTARVDGAPAPDPAGGAGPELVFDLGPLPDGATRTLRYRVRLGAGAASGNGINTAQASSTLPAPVVSPPASARVRVRAGVFTDRGLVVGKVFVDGNRNGVQDPGEPGIPGVRLYLENGTHVTTDEKGKYSLYGIRPGTHVLKVDRTSLPAGSRLALTSNRQAGDPDSRFVDLRPGELHQADFAEVSGNPALPGVVAERAAAFAPGRDLTEALTSSFRPDGEVADGGDGRARPSAGVVRPDARDALLGERTPGTPGSRTQGDRYVGAEAGTTGTGRPGAPPSEPVSPPAGTPAPDPDALESLLDGADPTLAFLEPADGAVLGAAQTRVRVKGRAGGRLELLVNGTPVAPGRVGQRSERRDTGVELREYVGVSLSPGANRLELVQRDAFGNERGRTAIAVTAPGDLARLELRLPPGDAPADGRTVVRIAVLPRDAAGVPVAARTPVTLESTLGTWQVEDLDPRTPGVQTFVSGGAAELPLLAPDRPGTAELRASAGRAEVRGEVVFVPALRPMIAAGVVEGVIGLAGLDAGSILPAESGDGFEEALGGIETSGSGELRGGTRAALFLKGKIRGDALLTLAYDSQKDPEERLFRDIRPDEFYPVYGDASERGFDAQSTGRLYVRVDKERSYLLYGDYTTPQATDARKLGAWGRSLNGLRAHAEGRLGTLDAFLSRSDSGRIVEEIPGRGLSGPYVLGRSTYLPNSEQVEIVVRDRDQPGIVLSTEPQVRFADYEISPFTGEIFFHRPVPSRDAELNPVFVRVTYEVEEGASDVWVGGLDGELRLGERLRVGAGFVEDPNPTDPTRLLSARLRYDLGRDSRLVAELARSETGSLGTGQAGRVELLHQGERLDARAFLVRTDEGFGNASSGYAAGREEAGAELRYRLDARTALVAEGLRSRDVATDGRRQGVLLGVERAFGRNIRAEAGVRWAEETATPAEDTTLGATPIETTSVRAKLTVPVPRVPAASVFGEVEQDLRDPSRRLVALGGDYRFADRGRLYARHELVSSLSGAFALNDEQEQHATVVGFDWDYLENAHAFSEYRVRDVVPGREAEVALGLRQAWELRDGLRLAAAFERIHELSGTSDSGATAVSVGLGFTGSEVWKGTTRLEARTSETARSVLASLGLAARVAEDWSLLGRNLLFVEDARDGGRRLVQRLQLGTAYRPAESTRWNALVRAELELERDDRDPAFELDRQVAVLGAHLSYRPAARWGLSGRWASKLVREGSGGLTDVHAAHLLGGRVTYDVTERWDVGAHASVLTTGGLESQRLGLGAEVGYRAWQNLWLFAGYNFLGFEDRDLDRGRRTRPGVYLGFRFKFDEDLLGWLSPPESAP